MKLIAIETSTEACSAALLIDNQVVESYRLAPRQHTELILPMLDELLAQAEVARTQLDAVAFGRGPGAFTGVRIATGVTQGIAFALDIPVVPVSTLAALAHGAWRDTGQSKIATAIDARMEEVYWGCYQIEASGRATLRGEEQVCAPLQVTLPPGQGWFGAGSGWGVYGATLQAHLGDRLNGYAAERFPHAYDIALLGATLWQAGQAVSAEAALPVYLRDQVVQKKAPN
ncbi:MAG TPA: tRNA (adenosine(37)-N6)-threonylcarbamoyltransferase complex dimerization subunit type 1 TsaB [Gammaproteobacteria bacterium]